MKSKNLLIGVIVILALAVLCIASILVYLVVRNNTRESNIPPTLDIDTAIAQAASNFTATPVIPTAIPTITLTPTPWPTRTPLPTWTATNTPRPVPTRTDTPSITPTRATQKPGEGLGDPTWVDEFDTDDYWTLFDDSCFKTSIQNGRYAQMTKRAPVGSCWEVSWPRIQDFYLETVARISGGCGERDRYGIFFRGESTQTGYLFGVTCRQEFWLSFWDGETSQRQTLIDFTENTKIKIGPGEANKLAIQTTGDRISLYINDTFVGEVYDSNFIGEGLVGFHIASEVTQNFTVEYDYLAYWVSP